MKASYPIAALAFALVLPALAPATTGSANPAFEKLKSLAGKWTGQSSFDEGGNKGTSEVTVLYRVTAAGSAVEETLFPGTPEEMVTMYHMDGDQLVLVHYCAAGNQPHMKLKESGDPNTLAFEFTSGTNMKDTDMHMHSAKITFVDADHIKGVWSSMKDGKPAGEATFDLARSP